LAKGKLSKRESWARTVLAEAREKFGRKINEYPVKYSIQTDDAGIHLEGFVEDSDAADILRDLFPKKFHGLRTIVLFIDVVEDGEREFYYSDDE